MRPGFSYRVVSAFNSTPKSYTPWHRKTDWLLASDDERGRPLLGLRQTQSIPYFVLPPQRHDRSIHTRCHSQLRRKRNKIKNRRIARPDPTVASAEASRSKHSLPFRTDQSFCGDSTRPGVVDADGGCIHYDDRHLDYAARP